jgi:hypothetical protein
LCVLCQPLAACRENQKEIRRALVSAAQSQGAVLQKNAPAAAAAIIGTVLASLPAVGIATAWLGGQRTSPEFGNKL